MRSAILSALAVAVCSCSSAVGVSTFTDVPVVTDNSTQLTTDAGGVDVPAAVCVAGRTKSCPCADGRAGAQTCATDGTFGACVCFSLDAGADDAPDASPADAPATGSPPDAAARTYDFVVNRLLLDDGAQPGTTTHPFYGFNLDGRFSPNSTARQQASDCSHGDYFSTLDPDQNTGTCTAGTTAGGSGCQGGVDNQLPNVVQTVEQFQASLNGQNVLNDSINTGQLLLLIRVSDVSGPLGPALDDPSVTVRVYPAAHPTFVDCANIQRAGQTYAVDNQSLTAAGNLDAATFQYAGSIVHGRLRVNAATPTAAAPTFRVTAPLPGVFGSSASTPFTVNLYQTQLRVALTEAGGTEGNMGGYMSQSELIDALTTLPALRDFRDAAGPLIAGFVDVATGSPPACEGPSATPASQGGIGIGLGFTALPAVIAPSPVTGSTPGTCGAR